MSRAARRASRLEQVALLELDNAAVGILKPTPLERDAPRRTSDTVDVVAGERFAPMATGKGCRRHADDGDRRPRRGRLEHQHIEMIVPVDDELGAVLAQNFLQLGRIPQAARGGGLAW